MMLIVPVGAIAVCVALRSGKPSRSWTLPFQFG